MVNRRVQWQPENLPRRRGITMSIVLQTIIDEFSTEDQQLIQSKASVLAKEMVRHMDIDQQAHLGLVNTRAAVEHPLNVKQSTVS